MNTSTISRITTGMVALIAGAASYTHVYEVAVTAGEHPYVAAALPLAVDGPVVVGTLAILADRREGRRPRFAARLAIAFGVVATLACNIGSAEPTLTARLVAAVAPLAFLISVEVLVRRGKLIADDQPVTVPQSVPAIPPQPVAVTVPTPRVEPTPQPVAKPVATAKRATSRKPSTGRIGREEIVSRLVAAYRELGEGATNAAVAAKAGVGVTSVKAYKGQALALAGAQ
ncbi:DUF2637 domain-containing protein [Micromonospora sp. NPDC049891]|uniref:DUF2637 domain-containing protein n=1 Tax=Micromonospora sp. NPDC049891 TaxID=3155655 RepID=UPI0033E23FE2